MNEKTVDVQTACASCVFYTDKQCDLNRIDVFKNNNVKVTTDENGNHLIGTICSACRNSTWPHANDENKKSHVFNEIAKFDIIITCNTEDELAGLDKTIQSVVNQFILPNQVYIILDQILKVKLSDIYNKYSNKVNNRLLVKRSFVDNIADIEIIKESDSNYYMKIKAGHELSPLVFSYINDHVNIKLNKTVLIESDSEEYPIVVHTLTCQLINVTDVTKSIKKLAEMQDNNKMIKKWSEIIQK